MVQLATKADLLAMQRELQKEIRSMNMKRGLHHSFEMQTLQLTIDFGIMMVGLIVAVVIIVKLI